jgi:hypothetical protein
MKLSVPQQKALNKLTDEWQSSYELQVRLNTLYVLVDKGLVERKSLVGYMFSPRNNILFRKKVTHE